MKKTKPRPQFPANYRPVSNLSTMSKLLERLILPRIRPHITNSTNFSPLQSAYRPGFSTETALSHIFNNLFHICGNRNCAVMVGLDLSAAFNHQILFWIDSTLILTLTVSLGFALTFPTDLNTLSLASTLPPLLHFLPRFPRALPKYPCFSRLIPHSCSFS